MKVTFCALVLGLAAFSGCARKPAPSAEAPSESAAVGAMTAWLSQIDAGSYAPSWNDASRSFRDAITQDQWAAALQKARAPLGACRERTLASVLEQSEIPSSRGGVLKGEFALAQFKTSFAHLFSALETVTFEREADGVWRASGYFVKPAP